MFLLGDAKMRENRLSEQEVKAKEATIRRIRNSGLPPERVQSLLSRIYRGEDHHGVRLAAETEFDQFQKDRIEELPARLKELADDQELAERSKAQGFREESQQLVSPFGSHACHTGG